MWKEIKQAMRARPSVEAKKQGTSRIQAFFHQPGQPVWSSRHYQQFADEAYSRNVIAHRSITMIAQGAASVPWRLYRKRGASYEEVKHRPLLSLLHHPNPFYAGPAFFEAVYAYRLISGNAYVQAVGPAEGVPRELHVLRPDRVRVVVDQRQKLMGYRYELHQQVKEFPLHPLTNQCAILHVKNFHPLDDWYGLSAIEAASYSIDQHNQAAVWNQSLLQNGARPSGALVVKGRNEMPGYLSDEQFERIKQQLEENYQGAANSGRPLVLEGGLEWSEMGVSNKEMDFIEAKNSAAREIALSFGLPPQLLGIPGDNTYSNMQEARLALWEETIFPLLDYMKHALNQWLVPFYSEGELWLDYNKDSISALSPRREHIWQRVQQADFLTLNEKRAAVGLAPLEGGDHCGGERGVA